MQFEAAVSMIKKSCGILETRVGVVLFDVGCVRHESVILRASTYRPRKFYVSSNKEEGAT